MDSFFADYKCMIESLGLQDKPARLYNIDESWFNPRDEKQQKVVTRRDNTMPYKIFPGLQPHITITLCIRGDGEWVPPMFTYKDNLPKTQEFFESGPKDAIYTVSGSGHIDTELYFTYIKHIEPFLNQDRPIVILQDNHSSHENPELIEFCMSKNIHLFNFPPKVTHLIQPLDKLFGTFKDTLNKKRQEALMMQGKNLSQAKMPILSRFTMDSISKDTIRDTFRETGIFPIDRSIITPDLLIGDIPEIRRDTDNINHDTPLIMEVSEEPFEDSTNHMQGCTFSKISSRAARLASKS